MEKKGLMLTSLLFLINFVSAYGERSGILVGKMYLDLDLIISVGIFMTIFVALSLATRKIKIFHTEGARIFVSFVIALFSIYGLSKANVDYEKVFIDWGIQNFLMNFGAWIILAFCLLIIIIYNIRTLILIVSGAFIAMGITGMFSREIIYNWEISLMIGILLGLFWLWLRKKGDKFKIGKTNITPGMAILDIITTKGEKKYADGYRVNLELGFRQITKFYIRNSGEGDLEWRIKSQRGLRPSKTNGKLSKGMHSAIGIKSLVNDGHPREIIIYARGIGEKRSKTQIATIIITQGEIPPQRPSAPETPLVENKDRRQNLSRRIGIKNLTEKRNKLQIKLTEGYQEAEKLHNLSAGRKGGKGEWTKSKEGRKYYKKWYHQYQENLQIEKEIKKIDSRIEHLQKQIK